MAGALVACRPAGSVSVMVIGPEGLQEKSTEILNSNPEPACTVVGPLFTASKQSVGGRHFVQIWVVLLSPAVLFFKSTTLATFVRLPVAFSAATIGTVTRTESPLAHVTLAPRLQTNSGFADAVVTQLPLFGLSATLLVAVHVAAALPGTKPAGRSSVMVTPVVAWTNTTSIVSLNVSPGFTRGGPVLSAVKAGPV